MFRNLPFKTVPTSQLSAAFSTFTQTAFRLELLPHYNVPHEKDAIALYEAGKPRPENLNQSWIQILDDAHARGARIERVRHYTELTPYLRFEYDWGYKIHQQHHEIIRIITPQSLTTAADQHGIVLPPDFWLFDDTNLYRMNYDASGRFLGIDEGNPALVAQFIAFKTSLSALATPLTPHTFS